MNKMKIRQFLFAAAIFLLTACSPAPKTAVLVLYEDGGWHKPFTDVAVPYLEKIAPEYGLEITAITRVTPVNKEYLKQFDVILQLDYAPYNWPEEAFAAFEDYIDNGRGGWVGLHHATLLGEFDGFTMWQWFSDFMGGIRYENYMADLSDGTVRVEAPSHPLFQGVPESFVIPDDEWYIYDRNPRDNPDIKVLASVDEASYTNPQGIGMGDHPVIWTNTAKKAPNIYFQFGHSPKLMETPAFVDLLTNALLVAAGRKQ